MTELTTAQMQAKLNEISGRTTEELPRLEAATVRKVGSMFSISGSQGYGIGSRFSFRSQAFEVLKAQVVVGPKPTYTLLETKLLDPSRNS